MSEFAIAKLEIDETAATIAADRCYLDEGVRSIKAARHEIERQVRRDRFFLMTTEPYDPPRDSPRVINRMCEASRAVGVGPMATVAGTIAQEALEAMVKDGCKHGWVDNGGDVAVILSTPATMEVFAEPGSATAMMFELERTEKIVGICTSSGRLGHSISFGNSDVSLAVAENAVLADALATAIGNRVTDQASLDTCFDSLKGVQGFLGGLAMIDGMVAMYGNLPKIVEGQHNPDRLTVHTSMLAPRYLGDMGQRTEVRS